jgi:hypothetical protein
MKTYQVSWTESKTYTIQVEAENKEDAEVNAFEQYDHEWDRDEPQIDKDSIRVYEF